MGRSGHTRVLTGTAATLTRIIRSRSKRHYSRPNRAAKKQMLRIAHAIHTACDTTSCDTTDAAYRACSLRLPLFRRFFVRQPWSLRPCLPAAALRTWRSLRVPARRVCARGGTRPRGYPRGAQAAAPPLRKAGAGGRLRVLRHSGARP